MANDRAGAPGSYQNVSAQVRAQNDLNMVNADAGANSNGDDLDSALAEGRLTRAELVRNATNICRFLLTLPVWPHSLGLESDLDRELAESLSQEDLAAQNVVSLTAAEAAAGIDASLIRAVRGESTMLAITHFTTRCDIRHSAGIMFSINGTNSRIEKTAIYDIWKPMSKIDIGLTISMTIAVKASVLTDILSRWPNDSKA